jgi:hypothetical protein
MSDNQRKRGGDEPTGDGHLGNVLGANDFGVETGHCLPKFGHGDDSGVTLSNKNRHHFAGADVQEIDPTGR